eukprot:523060-Rhodomonas_salina.3
MAPERSERTSSTRSRLSMLSVWLSRMKLFGRVAVMRCPAQTYGKLLSGSTRGELSRWRCTRGEIQMGAG